MQVTCPSAYAYQLFNSCCANYRRKNDVSLHSKCDGDLLQPGDPDVCCYNDVAFAPVLCKTKQRVCKKDPKVADKSGKLIRVYR